MPKNLKLQFFNSGWISTEKKIVVRGASGGKIRIPALFAMIDHPDHGVILYDTGYTERFFDATQKWPYKIMRTLTPVKLINENIVQQLARSGVKPEDVKTIIISHGHVDHIPGVNHFPDAVILIDQKEWDFMQGPSLKIFKNGYLKSLYEDIPNPIEFIDFSKTQSCGPFDNVVDFLGDGTLLLVPLPGHTIGQTGLMVNLPDGRKFFLIGDAAWVADNYLLPKPPAPMVRFILRSNQGLMDTLKRLHHFNLENPDVIIVPSHCPAAWNKSN